ncbi:MAG: hypothetical protein A3F12_01005 [Gammaproteobacteria bacterium RIFCSPHIGHO2_12_FULL_38_14]|nr:MAG: hypothetical protein A3F12_01005 [Gammaproteobacteria bacterium RIFCSPHIGHO2_12_FULL_38_14]
MKRYNFFKVLYLSFYSKDLYRHVAMNWGAKKSLSYLLFLLALSWIPFTYEAQNLLSEAYKQHADTLVEQIPVLTIENGKISTPENRPYTIELKDQPKKIAVIDTTGQYKNISQTNSYILVTQTEVISQTDPDQTRIEHLPSDLNLVVYPQKVSDYIGQYIGYSWIILFFVFVVGAFIYRIFQAFFYALIGKVWGMIFRVTLSYWQIIQLTFVALTPVIILETILDYFHIIFVYHVLFSFILSMIYLSYGILANKKQDK